jgi:hypothetical protein
MKISLSKGTGSGGDAVALVQMGPWGEWPAPNGLANLGLNISDISVLRKNSNAVLKISDDEAD